MPMYLKITKEDLNLFLLSVLFVGIIFSGFYITYIAYAETDPATLTVTVSSTITAVISTDVFPTITPGGATVFATSTLNVNTNNTSGWNMTLSGDDQGPSNTVMDSNADDSVGITDQAEWTAGAATTTAGNAVQIGSFDSSGDVLAFRVMTASSSNGAVFIADDWWGTADDYADNANTLWAGIASTTDLTQIGNAGLGTFSASDHLNTVLYYLKVSSSQQGGAYAGTLTYTTIVNP